MQPPQQSARRCANQTPANRANSYSEVTNLFCRLPLPSFCDKVRDYLSRVPDAVIGTISCNDDSLHQLFTGEQENTGRYKRCTALQEGLSASRLNGLQRTTTPARARTRTPACRSLLTRKDNSSRITSSRRWFRLFVTDSIHAAR